MTMPELSSAGESEALVEVEGSLLPDDAGPEATAIADALPARGEGGKP